jgi:hypothetical protein
MPQLWNRKRSHLKNVAGLDLNLNFGILPFLSDVRSLAEGLINFRKKVDDLLRRQGKVITRHYKCPVMAPLFNETELLLYSETTNYRVTRQLLWDEMPTYTASCRFKYQLPDMSLLTNQAKAFLDALGVRKNLAIAWNAIPFSFIVDWFFNVGRWLDGLSTDNLDIRIVLEDFCHSVKYSSTCSVFNYDYGNRYWVSEYRNRTYIRKRCLPYLYPPRPTMKMPSIGQIRLGGSLVISQKFFPGRFR